MIANSLEHKSKKKKKIIRTLELRFRQLHEGDFETRKMRRAIGPHVTPTVRGRAPFETEGKEDPFPYWLVSLGSSGAVAGRIVFLSFMCQQEIQFTSAT